MEESGTGRNEEGRRTEEKRGWEGNGKSNDEAQRSSSAGKAVVAAL
jgi:hypothetical protein